MPFRSTQSFDPSHPSALALYCSDGRFTVAVEELLHSQGHSRLDTVTIPGGPALLNQMTAGYVDLQAVSGSLSFLIRGHAIAHVFLIAHEGCGYYRSRMIGSSPEDIARTQRSDLGGAENAIKLLHAGVVVRSFYARVDEGLVVFDEA